MAQERNLARNNPRLTIKLDEIFGKGVRDPALRQEIAEAVVARIQERTASGIDRSGKKFKAYSKSYKASDLFSTEGKSTAVNLRLLGDMLESFDIKDTTRNRVQIGFADGTEAAKAHGHITGGGNGGNLPVRDFFGISQRDIAEIRRRFEGRVDGESSSEGTGSDT